MKHRTYASAFAHGLVTGFCRALLPASFLLAIAFAPVTMLAGWRDWPALWRSMWDDPI